VLLDHREEVDQKLALLDRQRFGKLRVRRLLRPRVVDQADADVCVRQPTLGRVGAVLALRFVGGYAARATLRLVSLGVCSFRNLSPSSHMRE
jgi:hypothetical protein